MHACNVSFKKFFLLLACNYSESQAVLSGAVIEGDISPKPSHKQESEG